MPGPDDAGRKAQIAALQQQVAELQRRRRSSAEFRPWKPDLFYYLFVMTLVVFLAWATWPGGRGSLQLLSMTAGLLLFGLLCYAPWAVNRLRFWAGFRRPNRRLALKSESLRAEVRRLQNGA